MSKKRLTADEIEKSLSETIMNLSMELEKSRKENTEKIKKYEDMLKEKEEEIADLKEKLVSAKRRKDEQAIIESFRAEKEMINNELAMKVKELTSALMEVSNLNNQNNSLKQNIIDLEVEKQKLNKKIDELNEKYKTLDNQYFILQKQMDAQTEENSKAQIKFNEKDNKIEELNGVIQSLNDKIKKSEEQNNNLVKFVKEMRENEEKLNKEREELKQEKEKYNLLMKDIEKKKKEEKKKSEIEKIIKEENKVQEEIKDVNILEQENTIIELLCEFLLKLNNLQYYVSLFDLMEEALKKYDQLKYIYNLNSSSNESINDILYYFFEFFKSYISISGKNANLNNFLIQKSFKLTTMTKEDVEIIKKIYSIKFSQNSNILDVYRKKRELFFKSKELTFNVLKEKVLGEPKRENDNSGLGKNELEFLKITTPPLELNINFNNLLHQDYVFVKYQVNNVFSKLRELSISITNFPIFLIYSLVVNCTNLTALKINFTKDESNSNINDINKLNIICQILLTYLKNLESFSLINLPLLQQNLPSICESLKLSKLKKLTLNKCFTKKEDFNLILPVFASNTISEIDLSDHNFHIPSLLNTSILNNNVINEKLISIRFSNCELNETDIKIITNFAASSKTLRILDIGKNILSQLSCSTFGYCILKTESLETLRINECGINGENILPILNGKGSKTLKHINLNGNEIGDIGLVSISAFINKSPEIESIELENCGGTNMGFNNLVNMIQSNINCKIKYVNFHKNILTSESLDILRKFNDSFKKRKIVFALDKIEGTGDNFDIHCAIFT